jgi:toxin ParE1/3/4
MEIRWSPDAANLENIVEYIERESRDVAQRVGQTIFDRIHTLRTFPNSGRLGRVEGTRELPLPPLPFVVVYRVLDRVDLVEIVNVIHGAQRWPPES